MKTALTALVIMGLAATLTVVSAQPGQPSRAGMQRYDGRAGNSADYSARYNTNRNLGSGRYFDDMFNERRGQNYYQAPYQEPYQQAPRSDRGYYNLYNNPAVGTTYRY